MQPRVRYFFLLAVSAVLVTCSHSKTSYSAICGQCLQHAHGVERRILGLPYYWKERQSQASGGLMSPSIFSSEIPSVDPKLFEEIQQRPCNHVFLKGGFCRSSWGVTACGSYSVAPEQQLRFTLIDALYRAYMRIPDQELGRSTFAMIDSLTPIHIDRARSTRRLRHPYEAMAMPDEPLSILLRGLGLVSTASEWSEVLQAASSGDSHLKLLKDPALLIQRLQHSDPSTRLYAVDELAALNADEAWNALGRRLEDPEVGARIAEKIVTARRFQLFDLVIQADECKREPGTEVSQLGALPGCMNWLIERLSVQEIRALLDLQKPRVDRLALAAIRSQGRMELLDDVLSLLNRRATLAAEATIKSLLTGPNPFPSGPEASSLTPWRQMRETTSMGDVDQMAFTSVGKRKYRMQQEAVALGSSPNPESWTRLSELRRKWLASGGNEWGATALAEAMAAIDRQRALKLTRQ